LLEQAGDCLTEVAVAAEEEFQAGGGGG